VDIRKFSHSGVILGSVIMPTGVGYSIHHSYYGGPRRKIYVSYNKPTAHQVSVLKLPTKLERPHTIPPIVYCTVAYRLPIPSENIDVRAMYTGRKPAIIEMSHDYRVNRSYLLCSVARRFKFYARWGLPWVPPKNRFKA